jgi:hypothetical protein
MFLAHALAELVENMEAKEKTKRVSEKMVEII